MFSGRDIPKLGDPGLGVPRLGSVLLLTSFALMLWPTYPTFVIATSAGTAVGFIVLYAIVDQRDEVRISWILCTSLLFAYAGGSFSTFLSATSIQDFTIMTKERPIELISTTLALVYLCCGLLLIIGRFESGVFPSTDEPPATGSFGFILSCLGLILIFAAYLTGDLGYMGIQTDETQRVSVLAATATLIEAPLLGVLGYLTARAKGQTARLFYCVVAGAITISVIPSGRRAIVLAFLMIAIGFALAGGLRRWSLMQKVLFATLGGLFAYLMSAYFFALRLAGWELGNSAPLLDQLWLGLEFVISPSLQERFNALFYDNLRERTFMLGYLADLVEATQKSGPLYGEALEFYLRLSIPSVLDPGKDQVIAYQQIENLVHPKLGLPVVDQANTILTDGVTDFGIAGALIYCGGIVAFLRLAIWGIRKFQAPVTTMFGCLAVVHLALKPELALNEYLVPLRNLIWMLPLVWALENILGGAWGRETVPRCHRPPAEDSR